MLSVSASWQRGLSGLLPPKWRSHASGPAWRAAPQSRTARPMGTKQKRNRYSANDVARATGCRAMHSVSVARKKYDSALLRWDYILSTD